MTRYKKLCLPDGTLIDEHRHVMQQHLGRKLSRNECVHHINGDPRDNRLENLQVVSRSEHSRMHMKGVPRPPKSTEAREAISLRMAGEQSHFHRLKATDIPEIRKRREAGESYTSIAKDYGVSSTTILRACSGRHWWCVPQTPKAQEAA